MIRGEALGDAAGRSPQGPVGRPNAFARSRPGITALLARMACWISGSRCLRMASSTTSCIRGLRGLGWRMRRFRGPSPPVRVHARRPRGLVNEHVVQVQRPAPGKDGTGDGNHRQVDVEQARPDGGVFVSVTWIDEICNLENSAALVGTSPSGRTSARVQRRPAAISTPRPGHAAGRPRAPPPQ